MYTFLGCIFVFAIGAISTQIEWDKLYETTFSFHNVSHIVFFTFRAKNKSQQFF